MRRTVETGRELRHDLPKPAPERRVRDPVRAAGPVLAERQRDQPQAAQHDEAERDLDRPPAAVHGKQPDRLGHHGQHRVVVGGQRERARDHPRREPSPRRAREGMREGEH